MIGWLQSWRTARPSSAPRPHILLDGTEAFDALDPIAGDRRRTSHGQLLKAVANMEPGELNVATLNKHQIPVVAVNLKKILEAGRWLIGRSVDPADALSTDIGHCFRHRRFVTSAIAYNEPY